MSDDKKYLIKLLVGFKDYSLNDKVFMTKDLVKPLSVKQLRKQHIRDILCDLVHIDLIQIILNYQETIECVPIRYFNCYIPDEHIFLGINNLHAFKQEIFVTDLTKSYIIVFSQLNGKFLRKYNYERSIYQHGPAAVYVTENKLFVADFTNSLKVFSFDFQYLYDVGGDSQSLYSYLWIDNDKIYVVDVLNKLIDVYLIDGKFLRSIGVGKLISLRKILIESNELYASDVKNDCIQVFNKTNGTFISSYDDKNYMNRPNAFTIFGNEMFVLNHKTDEITIIDKNDKTLLRKIHLNFSVNNSHLIISNNKLFISDPKYGKIYEFE